jgi:hypothetical protein
MDIKDLLVIYAPVILAAILQWVRIEHRITKVETKIDLLLYTKGDKNK